MLKQAPYFLGTLLLLLLAAAPASAAKREPIRLWPKQAPGEKGDIGAEKETFEDKIIRISNVTEPTLTVFRPPSEKDTGAAVLICPGGGYSILAFDLEGTEIAEWFNSIGVSAFVLKYRVPARKGLPRYEAPLQDAQRALGLIRHRAKEWGIQPDRIGVLGFSAGGHLSATLCNHFAKRTYEAVDDADAVSCRPDFNVLIYPAYLVDNDNKLAAELPVTEKTPKTFIAMTEDDDVHVEGALFYYLALKKAKVQAEMHLYPTGGHGYGLRPSKNTVATWPQRTEQWMRSLGMLEVKK
jgi:acetyl esterase/lipase